MLKSSHRCFSVSSVVTFPTHRDRQGLLKERKNIVKRNNSPVQIVEFTKHPGCNKDNKTKNPPWPFDWTNSYLPWLHGWWFLTSSCKTKRASSTKQTNGCILAAYILLCALLLQWKFRSFTLSKRQMHTCDRSSGNIRASCQNSLHSWKFLQQQHTLCLFKTELLKAEQVNNQSWKCNPSKWVLTQCQRCQANEVFF